MTERIQKLADLTLTGKTYAYPTKTEFDFNWGGRIFRPPTF